MDEHPPGLVGVLSGDLSRYTYFTQSLIGCMSQVPAGTSLMPVWVQSSWTAHAVNELLAEMQPHHQWVQIWADDHQFEPWVLRRLLSHHVPLVAPLCALRSPPFAPSLFHVTADGYQSYTWPELQGQEGLLAVDTFGGPGCVIRREVIEAIGQPFFVNRPGTRDLPQEDLYSFNRCRLAGFQPYVDLDCPIGHCVVSVLYPHRNDAGTYGVRLLAGEDLGVLYPKVPDLAERYHAAT